VRTVRTECLDWLLVWSQRHLERAQRQLRRGAGEQPLQPAPAAGPAPLGGRRPAAGRTPRSTPDARRPQIVHSRLQTLELSITLNEINRAEAVSELTKCIEDAAFMALPPRLEIVSDANTSELPDTSTPGIAA
jgi:hypothetical protein